MRGSNEVFTSYEAYLERFDFYSTKLFTDAVNGKTGMTYFEALETENASSNDIERIFPEALRGPILRRAQFSEIGRMNDLVDYIFAEFKNDFFPGEEVSVVLDSAETMECVVREKTNFPELRNADGSIQRPGFSRYFVKIKETNEEALLDDGFMKRGRNVFTKQNVRSFLKNCLQREAWIGAPWLVKEYLAQQYRLPMTIPLHLTQEVKTAQIRQQQAAQREAAANKQKKQKSGKIGIDQLLQADIEAQVKEEAARAQIPKYPTEDLEVEPSHNGKSRPRLNFLAPLDGSPSLDTGLRMASMGPLLEVWNAFTVHWDCFGLDPFTFDEFLDAMRFSSTEVSCELLEEIHCAVLKMFVTATGDMDEYLQDSIPSLDADLVSTTDTPEPSEPATPIESTPRSRKSRLSQVQTIVDVPLAGHQAAEMLAAKSWELRISEIDFADGGWQVILVGLLDQLSRSEIWASDVHPILSHLAPADIPATRDTAREQYITLDINHRIAALQILVNLSFCTTVVRHSFEARNEEMTAIRKQKVDTQRRRKDHLKELARLELDRRENNPDAFAEDEEAKKEDIDTPMINGHPTLDESFSTHGVQSDPDDDDEAPSRSLRRSNNARKRKRDEEVVKREADKLEKLSKQKDAQDKVKKYRKILKDIDNAKIKVTDCEVMIEDFDDRLREMNIARMKSLGRDRFWGRWWWFERIGMRVDGRRPSGSSKKNADEVGEGYANGRLWVQGPLDPEREGFIEVDDVEAHAYASRHGMSVVERKTMEEGPEGVRTAQQWGYYDNADDIDAFIGWLDDRGLREKSLKKELMLWREDIVQQTDALRHVLHPEAADDTASAEGDAEDDDKKSGPRTRVSTRNRTYLDTDDVDKRWRCLKWRNTRAATRSGRHCEPLVKPAAPATTTTTGRGSKKGAASARQQALAPPADSPTTAAVPQQRKAASSRSGQSGRGIAKRVAGTRANNELAALFEAEAEMKAAFGEKKAAHAAAVAGSKSTLR